tara:strand:+ start:2521 stop:2967 length:447 start_codon:yes stop_codon:yes gene_type:complete
VASLLTTGRQIKGSALAGLTSVAQQEASQNIAEEQLKQAKEAQSQQLLGTGLGVAGAYAAPKIASSMAAKKAAAEALAIKTGEAQVAAGVANTAGVTTQASQAAIATEVAAAEGAATAAGGGGATALLTNPYTYAAIAAAFLLKKIFD